MRIVCISDTHNYLKEIKIPEGDILLHSGDATFYGYGHEVKPFGEWIRSHPHMYKVFVAGNHDRSFEDQPKKAAEWLGDGIIYLQDQAVELEINGDKVKIYGAPWQPWFFDWAFNIRPETGGLKAKWDLIPKDADVLVTHGPPYKLRDVNREGEHCGDRDLRQAIQRVRPKLHVCGHIHEGYGVSRFGDTLIANASICNRKYKPVNKPLVFDFINGKMIEVK